METLQVLTTYAMFGLIWVIQRVHYPSFRYVPAGEFRAFHSFHSGAISWLVLPLMSAELISGLVLLATAPDGKQWFFMALTATAWLSTVFLQVPCHRRLAGGKNDVLIASLIRSNWLRTTAWTLKALFMAIWSLD